MSRTCHYIHKPCPCGPAMLDLTLCVLSQLRVHKPPFPVAETFLCFFCVTFLQVHRQKHFVKGEIKWDFSSAEGFCNVKHHTHTLRDNKWDLLVIKPIHGAGVFTLKEDTMEGGLVKAESPQCFPPILPVHPHDHCLCMSLLRTQTESSCCCRRADVGVIQL